MHDAGHEKLTVLITDYYVDTQITPEALREVEGRLTELEERLFTEKRVYFLLITLFCFHFINLFSVCSCRPRGSE